MITTTEGGLETRRSFRDPAGSVIRRDGRILRFVDPAFIDTLEAFLASQTAAAAVEAGTLAGTQRNSEGIYEHHAIPFPSYPYEWPPAMLHAAGALTLDLADAALEEGFGLKDATPYNILFRGCQPVFVDVLSFEKRDPLDPIWQAYGQFARTFLLPLLASRYFGLDPHETLGGNRDGLEPETLYGWAGIWRRLTPPFLGLVTLPRFLGRQKDHEGRYAARQVASPEKARYVLHALLNSCRKQLQKLAPPDKESAWTGYLDGKSLYSAEQLLQKEKFVSQALVDADPRWVLDVGANEGHFSRMAAQRGSSVVAIDSDPAVVGSIWNKSRAEHLDILPLVVNLARPTPAMGWRNQECDSFLDRARERFDFVMMLAVMHHLLVTERIPLEELFALMAELLRNSPQKGARGLSRGYLLIEYVAPQDPMLRRIARGRDALYQHLTRNRFEEAAREHFDLVRQERIAGLERWLYLFRRHQTKS